MPDLLYLTHSSETLPSVRFRVLPFVAAARERGLKARWERYPKTALRRVAFFSALPKTDTIVLQKKLVSSVELAALRLKCRQLVYDFDDALWVRHPNQGACGGEVDEKQRARLQKVCSGVHTVVAGNSFLAHQVREVARRVEVLPTPLDTDVYVPGPHRDGHRPVVGWMGTACNLFFLPEVFEALKPLRAKIELSIVSDQTISLPEVLDGQSRLWSSQDEVAQLQAMDIGLMPLTDDEYTRGKCGFKLLQYMACGVVPVASDVGFNREIVTHGRDGFLAQSPGGFTSFVEQLARDDAMRQDMAKQARKTVVQRFGLKAATEKLFAILGF